MELGSEDVSLLERCPHFRGCHICTGFNGVGTCSRLTCSARSMIDLRLQIGAVFDQHPVT